MKLVLTLNGEKLKFWPLSESKAAVTMWEDFVTQGINEVHLVCERDGLTRYCCTALGNVAGLDPARIKGGAGLA